MLDFDRLRSRFAQFGGWRLVWQYARMGVLWTGVMALIRCALKGVSMKAAYPVITKKVDERLILRYRHILDDNKRRLLKERCEDNIGDLVPLIHAVVFFVAEVWYRSNYRSLT